MGTQNRHRSQGRDLREPLRRAICEGRRARRTVDSPLCRGVVCSDLCDRRPVQVLRRQRRKRRVQITARAKVGGRAIFVNRSPGWVAIPERGADTARGELSSRFTGVSPPLPAPPLTMELGCQY